MQQTVKSARYIFKHSIYISAAWNWFLEFVGRAAEAILVLSVLYSSAKLLPVVHMPGSLDVIVFVAQFVALDVGGLSLGKLAKQAKATGDDEGAKQAGRMSTALITIMIAGVVVVAMEQLFSIPGTWKLGIDTVLLVARSILAVLYGHIIHAIKIEDQTHTTSVQPELSWALLALTAQQELLSQHLASIQHVQETIPEIDLEAVSEAVRQRHEATYEAKVRQYAASHEAEIEAKVASFLRQHEAKVRQGVVVSEATSEAVRQLEAPKLRQGEAKLVPQNVVPMRQKESPVTDKRATVYQYAESHRGASSYEIATATGVPVSTVQRYLSERRKAEHEATGTDE